MNWLRSLSLQKKFSIIIFLIVVTLIVGFMNFWFGMRVMSAVRAYVHGEAVWSKAQKEAVMSLILYTRSFDERDYLDYLSYLLIPAGDRQAKLELEKEQPNLPLVRKGLIAGGNNPNDIDDLVFLYRNFRHVSYLEEAIHQWDLGDQQIASLLTVGTQIHDIVISSRSAVQKEAELSPLVTQIYMIDKKLTQSETDFSEILGKAGRFVGSLLVLTTFLLTIFWGITAFLIAFLIEKMVAETDKAKTEFVSVASHQMRTPMTIINWYVERLILQKNLSDEQVKDIAEISSASRRMIKLINDLLNTSRIELGTMKGELSDLNPREIVEQVIHDLQPEQAAKQVTIQPSYQEGLPHISGDKTLLTIIFQNLLSNAVKYSKKEGIVQVRLFFDTKRFCIEVTDQGCGIPLRQQKKIFMKMFRADNASVIDPEGSGLGLYIVKAIVDSTGGKIWFTSKENEGTIFSIIFPIAGMGSRK